MRRFVFFVMIILSIVLQSSFNIFLFGQKPDFLLIIVLFIALLEGSVTGFKVGFIVGLVEDLVVGKYFGMSILAKMLTGFLVGLVEPKIFKENYLVPIVTLFIGTILHEIFFVLFGNMIGMNISWGESLRYWIFPLSIYHALLAPFLYVPFYKFYFSKCFKQSR